MTGGPFDPVTVVANSNAEHDFLVLSMACRCGWRYGGEQSHATHQAEAAVAALVDAGFAIMPKRLLMAWQT